MFKLPALTKQFPTFRKVYHRQKNETFQLDSMLPFLTWSKVTHSIILAIKKKQNYDTAMKRNLTTHTAEFVIPMYPNFLDVLIV